MRLSLIAALLFTLCAPVVASAQDDPKAVAMELMQLVTPESTYEATIAQMATQMSGAMRAQGAALPADFEQKMPLVVKEAMPYAEMMSWSAELYAARFSVAELRELIAFYKTPTGAKLAAALPSLMGDVGKKVGTTLPTRLPTLMKKHGLIP